MWLYIPSGSSRGSAAADGSTSPSSSPSLDPSLWVTSSGKPTPQPLSWRGWKTRPWVRLLSGATLPPSLAMSTATSWISSWRGSPVPPSPSPASERGTRTSDGSGLSSLIAFAKLNPDGSFSRTSGDFCQRMLDGSSEKYSATWPSSGTMRNGSVSQRATWVPRTSVRESSSWPSARAEDGESCGNHPGATDSLTGATAGWRTPQTRDHHAGGPRDGHPERQVALVDQVKSWPTPVAAPEAPNNNSNQVNGPTSLGEAARIWPTPGVPNGGRTMSEEDVASKGATPRGKRQVPLEAVASLWPTPQAHDTTGAKSPEKIAEMRAAGHGVRNLNEEASRWPTPTSADGTGTTGGPNRKDSLRNSSKQWKTPNACTPNSLRGSGQNAEKRADQGHQVNLQDQVAAWPTPTAGDSKGSGDRTSPDCHAGISLTDATTAWPTPKARDYKGGQGEAERQSPDLDKIAEKWGTPRVGMERLTGATYDRGKHNIEEQVGAFHSSRPAPDLSSGPSSSTSSPISRPRLNPAFVSWLMGAPWWWTRAERINFASEEMASWLFRARRLLSFLTGVSERGS